MAKVIVPPTIQGAATPVPELDGVPATEDEDGDELDEDNNMSPDPKDWASHPLCVPDPFIISKVSVPSEDSVILY